MKKRILLLLFICLLTVGCASKKKEEKKKDDTEAVLKVNGEEIKLKTKENLKNMHYTGNYVDFTSNRVGYLDTITYSMRGITYFQIRLGYVEDNMETVKSKTDSSFIKKKVGDLEYEYTVNKLKMTKDDGSTIEMDGHMYLYENNDGCYSIMFLSEYDITDLENAFMKSVYFE